VSKPKKKNESDSDSGQLPSRGEPKLEETKETKKDEGYDDPPMTIWDHLSELRKRVIIILVVFVVCSGVAWEYRETLLAFMVKPYVDAWHDNGVPGEATLHFQSPAAAFFAYFKLSLLGGLAISSPIIFYQLWAFVAPGLYGREKRFVIPFVLSSSGLFVGGGYFGWRLAFPIAFKYLLGLGGGLDELLAFQDVKLTVTPTVMMGDYIDFVTRMLLGFGAIFEIPLIIFFLSVAGVVNYLQLIRFGRWYVVLTFLFAAIITPTPDISGQVLMAIPMLLLYAASILLAYFFGKPPTEAQREAYQARKAEKKRQREVERERKRKEKIAAARAEKARAEEEKAKRGERKAAG
jgi:sec-independent protein translocase protein TatC